ncbi:bifunctional 2-C-methyl-D-erythritol 4-phosphate cytidylyltransferase/2-C-methyl-D-erythritol 2,4-cyclodiphosphate synthase [Algirhabdus cladophorae]|uniref:bifunctional 2-C-methyl-D-erythritol 4-phosphate cytidylyltransferase/2-C-methyl-D-erythritol 2,4-cyclodiphosphate synthase n=1 Tax=Algirhabdus cladophorae TaxID=3377108 RepID=UPI003B845C74
MSDTPDQKKTTPAKSYRKASAVIVAAGRGTRAGGTEPKQWQLLKMRTVAQWSVAAFMDHSQIDQICLVIHPDDADHAAQIFRGVDVTLVHGGATRDASVLCGLQALADHAPELVLIHDVARPCVSAAIISDVIAALAHSGGAAPALPVTDALWQGRDSIVTGTQDRTGLYRAQTPQGFEYAAILAAHLAHDGPAADDVAVARSAGLDVAIVPGAESNLKITHPADFARAAAYLEGPMDIRTGNGFDVHRFGPGDHVVLCGVNVPHGRGLQGHSDADVGMHAVTDAIYGALGDGDIGQHFPPSDPQWKGAASDIFLRHAVNLAAQRGYRIGNVDCTLICEFPKIGPHQAAMKAAMAQIMDLDVSRVSVKATTSERLGFAGREEGIAALATATLLST